MSATTQANSDKQSPATTTLELSHLEQNPPRETGIENEEDDCPPADRGIHAYLFLATCFAVEGVVWGECKGISKSRMLGLSHMPRNGELTEARIPARIRALSRVLYDA